MTTESLIIEVTEKGARVVKRNLDEIGSTAKKSSGGVELLKRALGGLAVGALAAAALRVADAFTNMQNRLKLVTTGTDNLNAVTRELFAISNRTRTSMESTSTVYSRMATNAKELGLSQRDLLQFTESLNQAVALSGASAEEANAGLIQLAQGMASGQLQGDELRAVLEQLPYVADVIAKGLGVTRGQLRAMGKDGKIGAQDIIEAFKKAQGELSENFAKTVPTVGQSFTVLKNKFMEFIGSVDKSFGITQAIAKGIMLLANNLDVLAAAATATAVVFAALNWAKIAGGITMATTAMRAFTVAIATNPIGFIATAILAVVAALTVLRDRIKLSSEGVASMGDLMRAVWEDVGRVLGIVDDWFATTFGDAWKSVKEFFSKFHFSLKDLLLAIARNNDLIIKIWVATHNATIAAMRGLIPALKDIFIQAVNGALRQVERLANATIGIVNDIREKVGMDPLGLVNLQLSNENAGAARKVGQDVASAFLEGMTMDGPAEAMLNRWLKRAEEIGKAREASGGISDQGGTPSGPANKDGKDKAAKALEELQDKFRALEAQVDPTTAAIREYTANENLLNQAVQAGLLSTERKAELMKLMGNQTEQARNPLAALNQELDEQVQLLRMTSREEEIANQLKQLKQQLLQAGIILGNAELEQLRQKLLLIQQETQLSQTRRALLDQVNGPAEQYNLKLQALTQLLQSGAINGQQFNQMLAQSRIEFLETQNTFAAGMERALLKLHQDYSDVGGMIEQTITNAFGRAEQAIEEFARTGKFNFKDFAKSILIDIGKMIIKLLILKPILEAVMSYFGVQPTQINYQGSLGSIPSIPSIGTGGYAMGGVSSGPQLAWVSEGRYKHEAHVPLPNGRSIPVEMNGAQGGGESNLNLTIELYRGQGEGVQVQQQSEGEAHKLKIILGQVANDIAAGGEIDRTIRQVYKLSRAPNG